MNKGFMIGLGVGLAILGGYIIWKQRKPKENNAINTASTMPTTDNVLEYLKTNKIQ